MTPPASSPVVVVTEGDTNVAEDVLFGLGKTGERGDLQRLAHTFARIRTEAERAGERRERDRIVAWLREPKTDVGGYLFAQDLTHLELADALAIFAADADAAKKLGTGR